MEVLESRLRQEVLVGVEAGSDPLSQPGPWAKRDTIYSKKRSEQVRRRTVNITVLLSASHVEAKLSYAKLS